MGIPIYYSMPQLINLVSKSICDRYLMLDHSMLNGDKEQAFGSKTISFIYTYILTLIKLVFPP